MFIIKKLILTEWYKFFFTASLVLFLLITVANLISGFLRGNVEASEVLFNYLIEIPAWLSKIFPVGCLVASLFSINKLKNRNELTAIFASGYSRKNFIFDLILGSLFIALIQFIMTAYIQPLGKKYRHFLIEDTAKFRNLGEKGLRASTMGSGKIWYKTDRYFVSFTVYDKINQTLKDISLYVYDDEKILEKKYSAESITYLNEKQSWFAKKLHLINNLNGKIFPIKETIKDTSFPLFETPDDFKQIDSDVTTLPFKDLKSYIDKLEESGINSNEYLVIYYDKIASALICVLFTLFASIAIFNPNRRSASFGKNLLIVFVFTIFYWLIYSYSFEMGKNAKVTPLVATFGVPLFFSLFVAHYFYKNRKLK